MSLGIIIKGFNSVYFKSGLDFLFEFVPQIVLLMALFGWMDLLIIGKWMQPKYVDVNYPKGSTKFEDTYLSPPIITMMIDMFLAQGSNKDNKDKIKYNYIFGNSQQTISVILLLVSFICIPAMLVVKPMVLNRRMKA
jgi:V-type H+-transporting ATPase subunit a